MRTSIPLLCLLALGAVSAKRLCQIPTDFELNLPKDSSIVGIMDADQDNRYKFRIISSDIRGRVYAQGCDYRRCDTAEKVLTQDNPTVKYSVAPQSNQYHRSVFDQLTPSLQTTFNATGSELSSNSAELNRVFVDSALYEKDMVAIAGFDRTRGRSFVEIIFGHSSSKKITFLQYGDKTTEDIAETSTIDAFQGVRSLAGFLWYDGQQVKVLSCRTGNCGIVNTSYIVPPEGQIRSVATVTIDDDAIVYMNVDGATKSYTCKQSIGRCAESKITDGHDSAITILPSYDGYWRALSSTEGVFLRHCVDDLCQLGNSDTKTVPGKVTFVKRFSDVYAIVQQKDQTQIVGLACTDN